MLCWSRQIALDSIYLSESGQELYPIGCFTLTVMFHSSWSFPFRSGKSSQHQVQLWLWFPALDLVLQSSLQVYHLWTFQSLHFELFSSFPPMVELWSQLTQLYPMLSPQLPRKWNILCWSPLHKVTNISQKIASNEKKGYYNKEGVIVIRVKCKKYDHTFIYLFIIESTSIYFYHNIVFQKYTQL